MTINLVLQIVLAAVSAAPSVLAWLHSRAVARKQVEMEARQITTSNTVNSIADQLGASK